MLLDPLFAPVSNRFYLVVTMGDGQQPTPFVADRHLVKLHVEVCDFEVPNLVNIVVCFAVRLHFELAA